MTSPSGSWWALLPVKPATEGIPAKSRLARRPSDERRRLARAFARDTLAALLGSPRIAGVVVVGDGSPDGAIGGGMLDDASIRSGVSVLVADDPGGGLNAALDHARGLVPAGSAVIAVVADLPALRSSEVTRALDAAAGIARCIVCDAQGTGTTALLAAADAPLGPRFGHRSRAAHVSSGAIDLVDLDVPGLRRDVDTEVDLVDARRLGIGPATLAELAR